MPGLYPLGGAVSRYTPEAALQVCPLDKANALRWVQPASVRLEKSLAYAGLTSCASEAFAGVGTASDKTMAQTAMVAAEDNLVFMGVI